MALHLAYLLVALYEKNYGQQTSAIVSEDKLWDNYQKFGFRPNRMRVLYVANRRMPNRLNLVT